MSLVKTSYLGAPGELPLVLTPAVADVDLAEWSCDNRDFIEAELLRHGALLFRGFSVPSVDEFERFAKSFCDGLYSEYGDLPRQSLSGNVYTSTPYPPDHAILPHNESSQMHCWPTKIMFHCVEAATRGGETPVYDGRRVFRLLRPEIKEEFLRKGVMYVRNFTDGLDVSWQDFFRTSERARVEEYCRGIGIDFEWKGDGGLRTRKLCPAVITHPKTGELAFFNQIQAHHVSCLEPSVRRSMLSLFEMKDLPRNVYYGDGSVIEDAVMDEIRSVYEQVAVRFLWQVGDIIMLDNMLCAHARDPYVGRRRIVVSMGQMVDAEAVQSGEALLETVGR